MKKDWIPFIVIIIAVLLLMWEALFPTQGKTIYGGDLATQFYYWKGYLADNIRSGIIPFWNPYLFSGTPFLAHPSIAPFYPLTLLFIIFPLNQAFSLFIAVHLVIAGSGMYCLCRKYAGLIGALVAATTFALSGFFAARIYAGHIDLISTAAWIPFVLAATYDLLIHGFSRKRLLQAVFFWSMLIFSGYGAYLVFTAMLVTAFALHVVVVARLNKGNLRDSIKNVVWTQGALVISLLITSVQWLPTWELTKHSIRGVGLPYELASWGSLPLSGLKLFLNPLNRVELDKIVFNLGGGPLPNPFDHFAGRIPLFLAVTFAIYQVIAVIRRQSTKLTRFQRDVGFIVLISLVFMWIAFAANAPVNIHKILYTLVPFYRYFRMPIQHLIIPIIFICLLAGIGVSHIKHKALQIGILFLTTLELLTYSKGFIFLTQLPTSSYDSRLISYLKEELKDSRLLPHFRVVSPVLSDLDLNAAMKYGISTTSGYDPVILRNYYTYIEKNNGAVIDSLLQYNVEIPPVKLSENIISDLNIGYIIDEKGNDRLRSQAVNYATVFEGNTYILYKVVNPPTRFKLVPTDSNCNRIKGDVTILHETINSTRLTTTSDCESNLITSDVYYTGWYAKLDGKPKTIELSKNVIRTLPIPKGIHIVEFYFQPDSYIAGGFISFVGIVLLSLVITVHKKRYAQ